MASILSACSHQPTAPLANGAPYAATVPTPVVDSSASTFVPDTAWQRDQALITQLQRDTFAYMWDYAYPESGMVRESNRYVDGPAAVGGTGFGVAAIPVGVERGWITRQQGVERLLKLTNFLRDNTDRKNLHGAFPHWINGSTGETMPFGPTDVGADLVETSFLIQGLLIARAYFDGDGDEARLRSIITELWHDVDWNWFTKGENNGLYWHWDKTNGFIMNFKVSGFNECMITYVLAAASPTHPISPEATRFWYSTHEYQPTSGNGYTVEAGIPYTGPLFLTHYSYLGLDPRQLADDYVPSGYWVRNVTHALINRAYCLETAPKKYQFSEKYWGLTSSEDSDYYRFHAPAQDSGNDTGTVAPTAALSSMPYTPEYAMRVLADIDSSHREKLWGSYGPYDAYNLHKGWYSNIYLAIDQLPMLLMAENYRTGQLWKLFMQDADVQRGIKNMGLHSPQRSAGFPDVVVTLKALPNGQYTQDAVDLRRHPDTGLYSLPYYSDKKAQADFTIINSAGNVVRKMRAYADVGQNLVAFPQFLGKSEEALTLIMSIEKQIWRLPIRLH